MLRSSYLGGTHSLSAVLRTTTYFLEETNKQH